MLAAAPQVTPGAAPIHGWLERSVTWATGKADTANRGFSYEAPGLSSPGLSEGTTSLTSRLKEAEKSGFKRVSRAERGDMIDVTQSFRFQSRRQTITFSVPKADYEWSAGRQMVTKPMSGESQATLASRIWAEAAAEQHQQSTYDALCAETMRIRVSLGLGDDEYAELICSYVMQMPYDDASAANGTRNKYPVETAVQGTGVCADKSLLLAGLLKHESFRVALLEFAAERHMAVGLAVPEPGYRGLGLAFVESTSQGLVGEVGESYGDGGSIVLRSTPRVTVVEPRGKMYRSLQVTQRLLESSAAFRRAYAELSGRLKEIPQGDVEAYNVVVGKINACVRCSKMLEDHTDDREALVAWGSGLSVPR